MKKILDIKSALDLQSVLTTHQMLHIKGGAKSLNTSKDSLKNLDSIDATEDDKRRERPGGGISTHVC
jgi:hypothetical protein